MHILSPRGNPEEFFEHCRSADERMLLLDYDGTLAPFRVERDQARPYPGVEELLEQIQRQGGTRLVVVSGRTVGELAELLRLNVLPELWGCHGWQRQLPGEPVQELELPDGAMEQLVRARELAETAGAGAQLEVKPVSLALHWRGLDDGRRQTLQREIGSAWRQLALRGMLQRLPFDGGLELRCAGIDKGTAVERLLAAAESSALAIAYLGDDLTDEDAFRALDKRGLRVLVREELRPTAADLWLRPPQELLWFLQRWAELGGGID